MLRETIVQEIIDMKLKGYSINEIIEYYEKLVFIRDDGDYAILHTAIVEDVDVFITGDKDFYAVEIERPEILSPTGFLTKY